MGRFFGWFTASALRLGVTIGVTVLALGAIIVGVVVNNANDAKDSERAARAASEQQMIDACKDAVTAQLKYPGSAQWSAVEVSRPNGTFSRSVEGVVDSQNGFSALGRGDFRCTIKVDGRGSVLSADADLTMRE